MVKVPFKKRTDSQWKFDENQPVMRRQTIFAILRDPLEEKFAILSRLNTEDPNFTFVLGGVDRNEDPHDAAHREIIEETGYVDIRMVSHVGEFQTQFWHAIKKRNQHNVTDVYMFDLVTNTNDGHTQEQDENLETIRMNREQILNLEPAEELRSYWLQRALGENVDRKGERIEKYNTWNVLDAI